MSARWLRLEPQRENKRELAKQHYLCLAWGYQTSSRHQLEDTD